jgi:lipopolysaccharide-induced tumor necrosis factor-alpha factor
MSNDRQPVQGKLVRNPYAQMQDEVNYQHPEYNDSNSQFYLVPATYELNEPQRVPMGRPIQATTSPYQPNMYQNQTAAYSQQNQPMMVQPSNLNFANNRDHPTNLTCTNCRSQVTTVVNKQPGKVAFAWALILGMSCGLCCVPFCVDSCQDKIHYCPRCGAEAGKKFAKFM